MGVGVYGMATFLCISKYCSLLNLKFVFYLNTFIISNSRTIKLNYNL